MLCYIILYYNILYYIPSYSGLENTSEDQQQRAKELGIEGFNGYCCWLKK